MMDNIRYMKRAIELAKNGLGWVSPNPPVGCVIVDQAGDIIAEGWHERYGEAHAEVNALMMAGKIAEGATAYVTLMPCNHHGKTPPCTQALIKAGVSKVVVAVDDPDPVSGQGAETLRNAGIEVEIGLLGEEASKVMHGFIKFIKQGLPQLTLKYAMTLDGCIATAQGDSKWISSEESRNYVQQLRTESDAVMVGSQTLLADNPRLNVRDHTLAQPFRIIVDSALVTPPESQLFSESGGKVIVLGGRQADQQRVLELKRAGAEVLLVSQKDDHLDLVFALKELAERYGIRSILCEGGGGLAGALVRENLVDRVLAFVSPKLLGGSGISPTEGETFELMGDAFRLDALEARAIGGDILCEGWVSNCQNA